MSPLRFILEIVIVSLPSQNLMYDLGDATKWEFFFPSVDKPLLVVPGEEMEGITEEDEVPELTSTPWPPLQLIHYRWKKS